MKTQCDMVLDYLKSGRKASVMTLMRNLGIADPRARIRDLRDKGHLIEATWVNHRSTRTGRKSRYCVYSLNDSSTTHRR